MGKALTLTAVLVAVMAVAPSAGAHVVQRSVPWHKQTTKQRHATLHRAAEHYSYVCSRGRGPGKAWHCAWLGYNKRSLKRVHRTMQPQYGASGQDFYSATLLADRIWPGHGAWARRCAGSEGGFGRFIMNHQGSGAGGWLQFMSGTFYGYMPAAMAAARARGFAMPASARSWYSPLGQAVTGAYMSYIGQRGHWVGHSC